MNLLHDAMNMAGRYRLIRDRRSNEDYLHRYYLFLKDRKQFPFNVVLHRIVRSDDPIMHDHPWAYTTIILAGGYWEHTMQWNDDGSFDDVRTWKGPGSIIHRKAHEYHWLELDNERPATTLFFMGKQTRGEWGFLTGDPKKGMPLEWVEQNEYLESPKWIEYHMKHVEPSVAFQKNLRKAV